MIAPRRSRHKIVLSPSGASRISTHDYERHFARSGFRAAPSVFGPETEQRLVGSQADRHIEAIRHAAALVVVTTFNSRHCNDQPYLLSRVQQADILLAVGADTPIFMSETAALPNLPLSPLLHRIVASHVLVPPESADDISARVAWIAGQIDMRQARQGVVV